jgi:rSAM/selenodomain-associated transferase 2
MPSFSIIVPVLDEAPGVEAALQALAPLRRAGASVTVVDGGSQDATGALAMPLADRVIEAPRGRASQMNAGARDSGADILVFLHADTTLPPNALDAIASGLARTGRQWGRFDVTIAGADVLLRFVALLMNLRSRLTGVATGDQAIFVRREAFEAIGGFPDIPLMEDVAISKRLLRRTRPLALEDRVVTSARRWKRHGTLRTVFLMWRLRLAFALGADPRRLARRYDVERTSS